MINRAKPNEKGNFNIYSIGKLHSSTPNKLDIELRFLRLEIDDTVMNYLDNLKLFILQYKFKNQAEEILFFKDLKPQIVSQLIYYNKMLRIETKKPHEDKEAMREYLSKELDRLRRYYEDNLDFYKYHRIRSSYLDHKNFLRNKQDIKLHLHTFYFETDRRFATTHDYKVAKIMAHSTKNLHRRPDQEPSPNKQQITTCSQVGSFLDRFKSLAG